MGRAQAEKGTKRNFLREASLRDGKDKRLLTDGNKKH